MCCAQVAASPRLIHGTDISHDRAPYKHQHAPFNDGARAGLETTSRHENAPNTRPLTRDRVPTYSEGRPEAFLRGSGQCTGMLGRDVEGWAALDEPLFGQQPKISSSARNKGEEQHGRVPWPPRRTAAPGSAVVEVELIEHLHVHERLKPATATGCWTSCSSAVPLSARHMCPQLASAAGPATTRAGAACWARPATATADDGT